MKIAITGIHVTDPIAAFKFYTEVLGFKEFMFMPEHKLAIVVSKDQPNGTALLLEPNDNPIAKTYMEGLFNAGLPAIVLGVDDVEKNIPDWLIWVCHLKNNPLKLIRE